MCKSLPSVSHQKSAPAGVPSPPKAMHPVRPLPVGMLCMADAPGHSGEPTVAATSALQTPGHRKGRAHSSSQETPGTGSVGLEKMLFGK